MIGSFFRKSFRPKMSIILIVYNMEREAPRTLQSLSSSYQQNISSNDYEVIVVDNGSPKPLGKDIVTSMGKNFQYHYITDAHPSPAAAINFGVKQSKADIVCIMIDGARILTPGLLHHALLAFKAYEDPSVAALGWHIGPEAQQKSVLKGYSKEVEDQLLAGISWPDEGYRLFEISSLAGSSNDGCFCPIAESNTIFIKRDVFDEIGRYDTAFDIPGGGLINLDFYRRACERKDASVVILLGEGSFHQVHNGVSTNIPEEECSERFQEWAAQYLKIRGIAYDKPKYKAQYLGVIPPEAIKYVAWSAGHYLTTMNKQHLEKMHKEKLKQRI